MSISSLKVSGDKSEKSRAQVAEKLAQALAGTYALTLKTQYYHWNVTGPQFIALHKLFEGQYDALAEANDEIAERIRALGQTAPGTFREFAADSMIKEDKSLPANWQAMVKNLSAGHEALSQFYRDAIPYAQDRKDEATADLFIGRIEEHDKAAWMLRAHLQ